MSSISITIGDELKVDLAPHGRLLSFDTTAYLGEDRYVYARDTVHFHGDPATLRAFAAKLLAAFPVEAAPPVAEPAAVDCQHPNLRAEEYDFGVDPESGYRDAGCRYICADCGEEFDEEGMARERKSKVEVMV